MQNQINEQNTVITVPEREAILIGKCKLDKTGRVVIPIEMCRTLVLEKGTLVNIILHGNEIMIRKFTPEVSRFIMIIG